MSINDFLKVRMLSANQKDARMVLHTVGSEIKEACLANFVSDHSIKQSEHIGGVKLPT